MKLRLDLLLVSMFAVSVAAVVACGTDRPVADQPSEPGVGVGADSSPTAVGSEDGRSNLVTPQPFTLNLEPTPAPTSTPLSLRQPTATPRPFIDVPGVIKSFDDIPPPRGPDLEPPYLTVIDIRARIGELAPGYGGIYVSGDKIVIILNDWSQIERAIAAVAAFYGADRITETVRIEQGGYALSQLSAWYRTAQNIVWPLGGVGSSGIDEVAGRIEFDVVTQKTADTAREALKGTGIPEDAIYFQVRQPALLSDFTTNLRSTLGIDIELQVPSSVVMDDVVEFTILLTNNGEHVVDLSYLETSRFNFVLFDNGIEVWSKNGRSSGIETSRGERSILKPGEAVRFATEWSFIDNDLEPIQPGEYTIIGWASGLEDSDGLEVSYHLVSEPQPITIVAE